MHQLRQTAVELPGTCQNAGRRIHHTLQFVGDDLRSPVVALPVPAVMKLWICIIKLPKYRSPGKVSRRSAEEAPKSCDEVNK